MFMFAAMLTGKLDRTTRRACSTCPRWSSGPYSCRPGPCSLESQRTRATDRWRTRAPPWAQSSQLACRSFVDYVLV